MVIGSLFMVCGSPRSSRSRRESFPPYIVYIISNFAYFFNEKMSRCWILDKSNLECGIWNEE